MAAPNLRVDIIGNTKDLDKALKRSKREAGSAGKDISQSFDKVTKSLKVASVAAGALAAGGLYAMNRVMSESIALANEQEKVEARLAAVLKATGEAAGYSISQLKGMASAMQSITTTGDEVILSGMAILGTFKNIAGQGFERATMAALDMANVMGTDLNSSILQIGKALNDPIKGLTSLQRVGVAFTDDQKKMIKSLQESGNMLAAQGIILDELESQFKGAASAAADTFGGKVDQLRNSFGDMKEELGFSITKSEEFKEIVDEMRVSVEEFTGFISANRSEISAFFVAGVEGVRDFGVAAKGTYDSLPEWIWKVGIVTALVGGVHGKAILGGLVVAADTLRRMREDLETMPKGVFGDQGDQLAFVNRMYEKGFYNQEQYERVLDRIQRKLGTVATETEMAARVTEDFDSSVGQWASDYDGYTKVVVEGSKKAANAICADNKKVLTCEEKKIQGFIKAAEGVTGNWETQHKERGDVMRRSLQMQGQMAEQAAEEEKRIHEESTKQIIEFREGMTDDMANIFDDYLTGILSGQIDDFGDMFEELFDSILQMFTRMISQMIAEWMAAGVIGMVSGQGFGGFSNSTLGKMWSGASAASSVSGMSGGPTAGSLATSVASYFGLSGGAAGVAGASTGGTGFGIAYGTGQYASVAAYEAAIAAGVESGMTATATTAAISEGTATGASAGAGASFAGAGWAVGIPAALMMISKLGKAWYPGSAMQEGVYTSGSGNRLTLTSLADDVQKAFEQLSDPAWVKAQLDSVQQQGQNAPGDMGGQVWTGYADTISGIFAAMGEDLHELEAASENGGLASDAMRDSIGSLGDKLSDVYTSLEIEAEQFGDPMAQIALQMGNSIEAFDAFVDASLGYDAAIGDSAAIMNMASAAAHGNADAYSQLITSLQLMGMSSQDAASAANQMMAVLANAEQQFNSTDFNLQAKATIDVEVTGAATATAYADAMADSDEYASGGLLRGGSGAVDDLYMGTVSGRHVLAQGGEFFVNAKATRKHLRLLEAINADGYASGGAVGSYSSTTSTTGWDASDIKEFQRTMERISDTLKKMGMTDYEKSLTDINDKYREIYQRLRELGSSQEDLAAARLARLKEVLALENKRQNDLDDLLQTYRDVNENLDAYSQTLLDNSRKYEDAIERAKKLGATQNELNEITEAYLITHQKLVDQHQEAIDNFMSSYEDIIATSGMSDYEKQVYALNQRYAEAIKQAKELGVSEEDLLKIEQARRIELERLTNASEGAFTNLADVLQEIEDFGIQGSVTGHATVGHASGGIALASHYIGEAGAEAMLPLRHPKQVNHIEDKLDTLLNSAGTGDIKVAVYIGNEKLDGRIEVISDRVANRRQRRGVQGQMVYSRVN